MGDLVIGIDLGTTNSCVGIYMSKNIKILENREGSRTTPSCVFLTTKNTVVVGQYAKKMSDSKPEFGIYEIKRLIGRKFDDPYVQRNIQYLPFQVRNASSDPVIVVETGNGEVIKRTPVEICTHILQKLKMDVETKLGESVNKAVITVPAYFSVPQREATLNAAAKAGFQVLKLLNEPTAAALSHFHQNNNRVEDSYSLVFDLGGGTFDVAILHCQNDDIKIIGVDGDSHLGGHDFDNLVLEYLCNTLIREHSYNPRDDRRSLRRLRNECEEAKKILSVMDETEIDLTGYTEKRITITLKRSKFEELCTNLFRRTVQIVERCIKTSNLEKSIIKEVILCGGSTRIPKIQEMIREFFDGKVLNQAVHPDECVAEGAAIQAAMLSESSSQSVDDVKVTDVVALSLGISNFVDAMTFLIKRNTPLPATAKARRVTVYNAQVNMSFDIYEGERTNARKNYHLGFLEINGLTPAPPGDCSVELVMSVDQNGILTVTATETVSGRTKDLKIEYTRGRRSDAEIEGILTDAVDNEEEDERFQEFAESKGYVMKYCIRVMYNLDNLNIKGTYGDLYKKCEDTLAEVKKIQIEDEGKVEEFRNVIVSSCAAIVRKYSFQNMP